VPLEGYGSDKVKPIVQTIEYSSVKEDYHAKLDLSLSLKM
jgi:hypothetical protein